MHRIEKFIRQKVWKQFPQNSDRSMDKKEMRIGPRWRVSRFAQPKDSAGWNPIISTRAFKCVRGFDKIGRVEISSSLFIGRFMKASVAGYEQRNLLRFTGYPGYILSREIQFALELVREFLLQLSSYVCWHVQYRYKELP